jgi:hypothetical protein
VVTPRNILHLRGAKSYGSEVVLLIELIHEKAVVFTMEVESGQAVLDVRP